MEQADLGYIDEKIKQMQLYVTSYGSQKLLEEDFSCEYHAQLKYTKEHIVPEPGLMMYYYRSSKPTKLFTAERTDYVKVWVSKSNKFLKAVRENGRFTYINYYRYFDTLQIKFSFVRNTLDGVQLCEYDENTRLISSVTNFGFVNSKDDNDNKDIMWSIKSVDGEVYSYESWKFSEAFKYWLTFRVPYLYDTAAERSRTSTFGK